MIELLIVIAVAGMVLTAIMTFFLINFRTFNRETDDLWENHWGRFFFDTDIETWSLQGKHED